MCGRIFLSTSPAPFVKCRACKVGIGMISKKKDLGPTPVEKATGNEVNKGSTVWDFLKVIGYVWGSGGVLHMAGKYVHRKPIQRGDLLHVILPLVGAGIIEDLQRPKMAGGQSAPPPRTSHNTNHPEVIIKGPTINLTRDQEIKRFTRRQRPWKTKVKSAKSRQT